MQFPLSFLDISLWLAVTSIILLVTAELILPTYLQTNLLINKSRLRIAALTLGILFIITVLIQLASAH
jgi:hypothetical protein